MKKEGRITIPVKVRKKLGIKEGTVLEVEIFYGKILLVVLG